MKISKRIIIEDNKLLDGLKAVFQIIEDLENSEDALDTIDFKYTPFVNPLFVLPLVVYTNGSPKDIQYANLSGYMKNIEFGTGKQAEQFSVEAFSVYLNNYIGKTYIPIINFPSDSNAVLMKNSILSAVENLIARQLGLSANVTAGLKYMIEECVDNITEHSESRRGYIFAQAYPQKRFVDVCIADSGITLLGSYKKMLDNPFLNDLDAIQAANRGMSTKNLPDAENRGYGIITSKKMLIEGLSGSFIMLSGRALHLNNLVLGSQFIELPEKLSWKGTIISLRIPYVNSDFRYINFVEG